MPTSIYGATPMLPFRGVDLAPGLKEVLTLPRENRQIHAPWGSPGEINRRYIIGEAAGNVLCTFETMRSVPDSHEFRLENGGLRYVHTMTVMRDLDAEVDEE